jgi:hypothetical protein
MAPKNAFEDPPPENVEDEEYLEDEDEEEDDDYMEGMDMGSMFAPFLTTEDGDNVCTALVTVGNNLESIHRTLENQNKILIKILSQLSKKES